MADENGERGANEPGERPAMSASPPVTPARAAPRKRKARRHESASTIEAPPIASPFGPLVKQTPASPSQAPERVTVPLSEGDRTVNVTVALQASHVAAPAPKEGGDSKRVHWIVAAVVTLLTAGGLTVFRDVLVYPVWGQHTSSFSRDTLRNLVGNLSHDSMVVRTRSLTQLGALMDRKGALVPLARSALLDVVRTRTVWQDSGTRCPISLATQPDIGLALHVAVRKRAPARVPWFFASSGAKTPSLDQTNLRGADLRGADLRSVGFAQSCLAFAHLEGADLRGAHWEGVHLEDAHLTNARLEDAHLEKALLSGRHLAGAHLRGAHLDGARLDGADFSGAHLEGAVLNGAQMHGTVFREASLQRAQMEFVTGRKVLFTKSRLEGASLNGDTLVRASFRAARMACATFVGAVIDSANFTAAQLPWVSLDLAKLPHIRLRDQDGPANVNRAFIRTAELDGESVQGLLAPRGGRGFWSAAGWSPR